MNFDPYNLLLGFAISTIGFAMFRWGKKKDKPAHLIGGILLIVTPYLCPNIPIMLLACGGIAVGAFVVARGGG